MLLYGIHTKLKDFYNTSAMLSKKKSFHCFKQLGLLQIIGRGDQLLEMMIILA